MSRGDDEAPELLDVREERFAALLGDDLAQQPAEQAHVAAQLVRNLSPRSGAGRFHLAANSSESSNASNDASMMLLEHPTVAHRFDPLPDSTSTRVVAAVPAAPSRMRTL